VSLDLTDRVVIVTGAARGIGRSHCIELAALGATVVVNDLDGAIEGVVGEIEAAGGRASAVACSVTDLAAVRDLVATTLERHGRLDAVVANAGILRDRVISAMTEEDFDAVVEVHLKGTWTLTKAALDHWRAESKAGRPVDARIVTTTSGTGLFGNVGQANYGAAKAGIANFTTIAAMELERYGVTVNAVSPIARTRMTEGLASMPERADVEVDRFDPVHASRVVAWLVSAESSWLTGAVFRVDGPSVYRMRPWEIDAARAVHGGAAGIDPAALDTEMRRAHGLIPAGVPRGGIFT